MIQPGKSHAELLLLLVLLCLSPTPPALAREVGVAFIDVEDPFSKMATLGRVLEGIEGASAYPLVDLRSGEPLNRRLLGTAEKPLPDAEVLMLGSWSTSNRKVRRLLRKSREVVQSFVSRGGVLIIFGQADEGWNKTELLPGDLLLRLGPRTAAEFNPDWSRLGLPDQGLSEWEIDRGPRRYSPQLFGTTDLVAEAKGFTILARERGPHPRVAAVGKGLGRGLIIYLALTPDRVAAAGMTPESRAAAAKLMKSLISLARTCRDQGCPSPGVPSNIHDEPRDERVLVFHDLNGDGRYEKGEPGLPRVEVLLEDFLGETDAKGVLTFSRHPSRPATGSILVPEDWRGTGRTWFRTGGARTHRIGLAPESPTKGEELVVVQLTDLHLGREDLPGEVREMERMLAQVKPQVPADAVWAFTGDLTHMGTPTQLRAWLKALHPLPRGADLLQVMGNHDQGTGPRAGELFQRLVGPLVTVVERRGFRLVTAPELRFDQPWGNLLRTAVCTSTRPVLLFVHHYPERASLDRLSSCPLHSVFSGHWHGNLTAQVGHVNSFNTSTGTMGGWDFSPPTARITRISGSKAESRLYFRKDGDRAPERAEVSGPGDAPGFTRVWTRDLEGTVLRRGALVRSGRVFVQTRGQEAPSRGYGQVRALDLKTGEELWSAPIPVPGDSVAALAAGRTLLFVTCLDGTVQALEQATGQIRWTFNTSKLSPVRHLTHWLLSGPRLYKGKLYFCYQGGPFVLDAETGEFVQQLDSIDSPDSLATTRPAIGRGELVCGTFLRGLYGFRINENGRLSPHWQNRKLRVTANPVFSKGKLWVRSEGSLLNLDPGTGQPRSSRRLARIYSPAAPIPGSSGVLVTGRQGRWVLMNPETGKVAWTQEKGRSLTTFETNRFHHPSDVADPIKAWGGFLIPTSDGRLTFLNPANLQEQRLELGSPLASPPAIEDDWLVLIDLFGRVYGIRKTDN